MDEDHPRPQAEHLKSHPHHPAPNLQTAGIENTGIESDTVSARRNSSIAETLQTAYDDFRIRKKAGSGNNASHPPINNSSGGPETRPVLPQHFADHTKHFGYADNKSTRGPDEPNTPDGEQDTNSDAESSEDDDGDDLIPDVLSSLTTQLVACVINVVDDKPTKSPPSRCDPENTDSSSSRAASRITPISSQDSNRKRGPNKGRAPGSDDEDGGDDDDGRKRRKPSDNSSSGSPVSRKLFACPFHKHNPQKYCSNAVTGRKFHSCGPPGFPSIHRIKLVVSQPICSQRQKGLTRFALAREHIYRQHSRPIECPRCFEIFQNQTALEAHQRAAQMCEVRQKGETEGITQEQQIRLRSRVRYPRHYTEEDKWKQIYRLIFPDQLEIPRPCKCQLGSFFRSMD